MKTFKLASNKNILKFYFNNFIFLIFCHLTILAVFLHPAMIFQNKMAQQVAWKQFLRTKDNNEEMKWKFYLMTSMHLVENLIKTCSDATSFILNSWWTLIRFEATKLTWKLIPAKKLWATKVLCDSIFHKKLLLIITLQHTWARIH